MVRGTWWKRQYVIILNNILYKIKRLQFVFPNLLFYSNLPITGIGSLPFSKYPQSLSNSRYERLYSFKGTTALKMSFFSTGKTNFWSMLVASKATNGTCLWYTGKFERSSVVGVIPKLLLFIFFFKEFLWKSSLQTLFNCVLYGLGCCVFIRGMRHITALMKRPENNFQLTDGSWKFYWGVGTEL